MYAIGLSVFKFYVELLPEKRSQLLQVVTHLKRHSSVMWIAQLGGSHQLVFSLCAGDISGVYRFQRELLAELGAIFLSIDLLVQVQFTAFGRRYLDPGRPGGPKFTFGCSQRPAVKIDKQDHKILVALSSGEFKSEHSMAHEIDIPLTTVRRRMKALESSGVIRGYIYRYNLSPIGMLRFNLLVSIRGLDTTLPERMVAFCSRQAGVVNVGECIGAWQFEITTDVVRPSDTEEVLQALYAEFPAEILNARTVPVFQSYKYASYPGE
jgi:DNA-binding Lrp family transcriptional regulator